ncbi:YorT [Bacillus subtilis QB928]|nr:YorT [Bacillus subtilis QB928]
MNENYFKISHLSRKEKTVERFIKRLSASCESTIHHKVYQIMNEAKTEFEKVLKKLK